MHWLIIILILNPGKNAQQFSSTLWADAYAMIEWGRKMWDPSFLYVIIGLIYLQHCFIRVHSATQHQMCSLDYAHTFCDEC